MAEDCTGRALVYRKHHHDALMSRKGNGQMKYTLVFGCGHEDTVTLFGKMDERDRKLEYFKAHGLCKECYKKMCREKEEEEGLIFNIKSLPNDKGVNFKVWYSGNTFPYKDEIKACGYWWNKGEGWEKEIQQSELQAESEEAIKLGAKIITH